MRESSSLLIVAISPQFFELQNKQVKLSTTSEIEHN